MTTIKRRRRSGQAQFTRSTQPLRRSKAAGCAELAFQRSAPAAPPDAADSITLAAYLERSYRPLMLDLAASTRDTYERELRLRVLPALGELALRDIDRTQVQRMLDSCQTRAVAGKALGVLRTVLEEALCDGIVAQNVAKLRYHLPPAGKPRDNGLVIGSFAQMQPLFSAIDAYADDGTVEKLACTGLLLGLRPQERYGLDWGDFDFRARTVRIERAYLMVSPAEGTHDLKGPKSANGRRVVPLPKTALARIRRLRGAGDAGPFLKDAAGGRLSPSTGRHRWKTFLAWCGEQGREVPQVTLENMRHSFATSFLAAGGNVENLARIMGHANITTTLRRYVRPSMDNIAADMRRVDL